MPGMPSSHHRRSRSAGLVAIASLACSAAVQPAPAPADAAQAARKEIDQRIGSAACRRDSDCATLPLPEQACGGPRGWIAYAPAQTDRAGLARAIAALPADAPGAISTCEFRPDPGAVCRRPAASPAFGRCELRAPSATGSASPH